MHRLEQLIQTIDTNLASAISDVLVETTSDGNHLKHALATTLSTLIVVLTSVIDSADVTQEQKCLITTDMVNLLVYAHDKIYHADEESPHTTVN
jgi:hypothetical protein